MAEHQVALDDPADTGAIPPPPAQPVAIPPAAQYMSRWRFLLVLTGVWLVGAGAGAGLYFWWFHSPAKDVPLPHEVDPFPLELLLLSSRRSGRSPVGMQM